MNRIIAATIMTALMLSACAQEKTIDGVRYRPYGLANESSRHNPKIRYELVAGNVFWAVVLCETIIAPIYFVGFSLFQPVGKTTDEPK